VLIFWAFEWQISDQALLYASATLVAILPEAAIVLITVTMAISVRRMAASNAIVRKMVALEQLGKVTDICSDKTGTLTEGKMRPARLVVCRPDGSPMEELVPEGPANSRKATWSTALSSLASEPMETLTDALRALVLCSSTSMVQLDPNSDDLEGHGSPTELALMETAWKVTYGLKDTVPNLDAVRAGWQPRGTFDFDSKTKTMSTGWHNSNTGVSLCTVKGAPESILPRCAGDPMNNARLVNTMDHLASQGLRVLAVAQRTDLPLSDPAADVSTLERNDVEKDLRFLALCAVRDPPKQSSITAVKQCFSAGIVVRMLTGDHPATAEAIAKEIGIIPHGQASKGVITTGPKMDAMSDAELDKMDELPLIVARCSPESKVRMVEALHRRNKVAAMTGDGVNDSPSIKEADVGIAMGITGSDVTKGVADIVLADDNFATIVSAVREGRRIFASVSNFVMHLLSGNMAEAVVLLVSLAFVVDDNGFPIFVLSPIAILFINTATGSGPAIGIALDDCASDLMKRPPVKHSIFTKETIMDCCFYGATMGAMTLAAFSIFFWVIADANYGINCNTNEGTDCDTVLEARASSFLALNTLLLVHAYNCRHQRMPFWQSPLDNWVLLGSFIGGTLICVVLLYVPYLSTKVFKHKGGAWEWAMVAVMVVVFMIICEFYKLVKRTFLPPLTTYVHQNKLDSISVGQAKAMV
jgi:potassium/sodium efflux P-type ATPase